LETAGAADQTFNFDECNTFTTINGKVTQEGCLVKNNSSWIGFARYKLTKWVNLQAEYVATTTENQIGQTIKDNAVIAGTTFFW
jgi:hypothetical protein